jgi:hypothetical protein
MPMFPAYCKAAIVLKPRKQAFDFLLAVVTAEGTSILRAVFPIASMWSNHLDSGLG